MKLMKNAHSDLWVKEETLSMVESVYLFFIINFNDVTANESSGSDAGLSE